MSCQCNSTCVDPKMQELQTIIEKHKGTKGALIPVLHEAQELFGYLPIQVQKKISEGLGVSLAEIYGVVTFYTQFSLVPKGKYKVQVCLGTACYVKGSGQIYDKLKEELGLKEDGTTDDGLFSLEACRCIGACGLAPVIMINDDVYGRLVADDIPRIIAQYRNKG
ncbi:MAG: NAD(P)H-dependent oxidoreductase subunit E [Ruminiclostridium sp.]|nr:NAD(P)H-dependent oxidoreductase subunit E [Ruminiclostridium sp.]